MRTQSGSLFLGLAAGAIAIVGTGCAPVVSSSSAPPAPAQWNLPLNTTIDLNAYRASLTPSRGPGHTRSRLGHNCGNCWADVTIQAYSWTKSWGVSHFPANVGDSYPIGHLSNADAVTTEMYSLKPNTIAEYDIYIFNDGGVPSWKIVEVPVGRTGQITEVTRGKYRECTGHGPKPSSDADFRNCDYEKIAAVQAPVRLANAKGIDALVERVMSRFSKFPPADEDPGWLTCTEGCCTMMY